MNRLLAVALPLLIAAPAFAQDPGGRGGWNATETKTAAEQRAAAAFTMLDADKDGVVTQAEIDAAAKLAAGNPRMADRVARMFTDADADHDGKLTAAEARARADRMFDEVDTDHDGTITAEERQAARAKRMAEQPQP